MKIKELLSDESKWTQGAHARDKDEIPVNSQSPEAVRWCLVGAWEKCYPPRSYGEWEAWEALSKRFAPRSVSTANDSLTFAEIKAELDDLDV